MEEFVEAVVVLVGPLEAGTNITACLLALAGGAPEGEVLAEVVLAMVVVTDVTTASAGALLA